MKGYLSIREVSYKWGVSERRVNQYVTQGRIPGVERFGRSWAIPENAKKPEDPRFSFCRFITRSNNDGGYWQRGHAG